MGAFSALNNSFAPFKYNIVYKIITKKNHRHLPSVT